MKRDTRRYDITITPKGYPTITLCGKDATFLKGVKRQAHLGELKLHRAKRTDR